MIIFETPQSSRSKIKVTLERIEADLHDVDIDEVRLLNPYNMLVTIPSKSTIYLPIFLLILKVK